MLAHIKREGDILNKVWYNSDFVKVSRAGGQKGGSKANSYEQGTSLMCTENLAYIWDSIQESLRPEHPLIVWKSCLQ